MNFKSPITPDELAGLACEDEVESRLVINWESLPKTQSKGKQPWELRHGPFKAKEFSKLPETCYTLLVQEVNRYVPEVSDLLQRFSFVPNWRVDDVMVSYAAKNGGVGPHVDNYDVFLVQGLGTRKWTISTRAVPLDEERLLPDVDLRILADGVKPEAVWELSPGDILYLPPRVPHLGVAMDDPCMTFSIGFR
eukprot:CAMPEP_0113711920 /NCGR_PEP_ID=MMETSP0038_2-20120614/31063_1 /TAXON_ID=2898 /ORGANISM="Cryptomonas paramecium" /LENGTH=192 /DNA_ID=CAMNT_0000638307 /DNA_START=244 /DNA_END=819 /DNA_ORIENTATION=- /assembly_acc=CAM_ASM_000170